MALGEFDCNIQEREPIAALVGESPVFLKAVRHCVQLASYDVTILLVGETGTGKELIARTIHSMSPRSSAPFVPVDCAAIPETLFAHEIFGHERGAFTDAREPKAGLLASANGGTLFLDEVESLPSNAQGALLRLLDRGEWRPLGSRQWRSLNCRIVAATNEDLESLIQKGLFRRDLYYRLAGAVCHLPPLRERLEDIPLLARYFLSCFGKQFGRGRLALSNEALSLLCAYSWPGNIRELENCLQHAALRAGASVLMPADLPLSVTAREETPSHALSWKEARQRTIESWERVHIAEVIKKNRGNLSQVARTLGLSRMQLYRLLKKHRLRFP